MRASGMAHSPHHTACAGAALVCDSRKCALVRAQQTTRDAHNPSPFISAAGDPTMCRGGVGDQHHALRPGTRHPGHEDAGRAACCLRVSLGRTLRSSMARRAIRFARTVLPRQGRARGCLTMRGCAVFLMRFGLALIAAALGLPGLGLVGMGRRRDAQGPRTSSRCGSPRARFRLKLTIDRDPRNSKCWRRCMRAHHPPRNHPYTLEPAARP